MIWGSCRWRNTGGSEKCVRDEDTLGESQTAKGFAFPQNLRARKRKNGDNITDEQTDHKGEDQQTNNEQSSSL